MPLATSSRASTADNTKQSAAVKQALLAPEALVELIAAHAGTITDSAGEAQKVNRAAPNAPSVVYDAVVIPGGASAAELAKPGWQSISSMRPTGMESRSRRSATGCYYWTLALWARPRRRMGSLLGGCGCNRRPDCRPDAPQVSRRLSRPGKRLVVRTISIVPAARIHLDLVEGLRGRVVAALDQQNVVVPHV